MCKLFYKFFKIFQKSLMSRFMLNVFSKPKFWRRHCSTGLERNSCIKIFLMSPPNQNSGAAPVYSIYAVYIQYIYSIYTVYIQYIYCIFMLSLVPPPQFLYVADPMDSLIFSYFRQSFLNKILTPDVFNYWFSKSESWHRAKKFKKYLLTINLCTHFFVIKNCKAYL